VVKVRQRRPFSGGEILLGLSPGKSRNASKERIPFQGLPPPHVHSYEDELFYVLEGEFDVYVGQEAFKVRTGECVFLPRFVPHAFVVRSSRLQLLTLFTPGGLEGAFRGESTPAQNLGLPSEAITYSMVELEQTARRFSAYGARFLTPDEIADQLPLYPKPLPPIPKTNTNGF